MIKAQPRNYLFNTVHMEAPERNGFDLSHENKQTCRAGRLYYFEMLEALPNDDFELSVEQLIRLQPMLSPTMHRVKSYWHWFFCPNRLVWKPWEEFISRGNGQKLSSNQDYTPPEPPTFTLGDAILCAPSVQGLRLDETLITSEQDIFKDEFDAFLTNTFPAIDWKTYEKGGYIYCRLGIVRTPRHLNALGLPDVSYPLFFASATLEDDKPVLQLHKIYDLLGYDVSTYLTYLQTVKLSLIPLLSTFKIYCDYYRDENLMDDGQDILDYFSEYTGEVDLTDPLCKQHFTRLLALNYRCWEKDYFTTASLTPQKAPDVLIPGAGELISHTHEVSAYFQDAQLDKYVRSDANEMLFKDENDETVPLSNVGDHAGDPLEYQSGLRLDGTLGTSCSDPRQVGVGTSATINMLRKAMALQRFFEKLMRAGTRYIETLKTFFNSDAGDARLQRPEFIGAMSSPIKITDVVQTSGTDDNADTVQGNLAGYGVNSDTSQVFHYHAPEHGFIFGVFSISARTSYSQGISRSWTRESWLDYAWQDFEGIGEQAIKMKELAFYPSSNLIDWSDDASILGHAGYLNTAEDVFGYQSRYSEYKQIPDRFGGGFVSSMDFWTLGRLFDAPPTLSDKFVEARISDRNFAVVGNAYENVFANHINEQMDESYNYDTYICDFWLDIKKVTSLSLYSEGY